MSLEHWKAIHVILGFVSTEKEDKTILAKATLTMYVTVLKHYHPLGVSEEVASYANDFQKCVARVIAQKKEEGMLLHHN
jgi:hypothetical protein